MNIQQEIVAKIRPGITNRERITNLNNKDLARFLTYVLPMMTQKYPDAVVGIEDWLKSNEPGQMYRNLMGDWS